MKTQGKAQSLGSMSKTQVPQFNTIYRICDAVNISQILTLITVFYLVAVRNKGCTRKNYLSMFPGKIGA